MTPAGDGGSFSLARLLTRSAVDRAYRHRLLIDPQGAIAELTHEGRPAGVRIRFVEQPHDVDALIVLPPVQPS